MTNTPCRECGEPVEDSIRIKRERQKLPLGYVMLRTGITTQRLEAIERGAVTATDAEVERISAVLQDR